MDEPYLPSVAVAAIGVALVVLVRRGTAIVRAALAAVALLPIHTVLVVLQPDYGCFVSASSEDCLRDLNLPGDMLRVHAVLAGCAAAGLMAFYTARWVIRRRDERGAGRARPSSRSGDADPRGS
jgi:hypothetical protein